MKSIFFPHPAADRDIGGFYVVYDGRDQAIIDRVKHQLRLVRKYAGRRYAVVDELPGYKHTRYLHQIILGVDPGTVVVHLNGDTLDNRRKNLLVVPNGRSAAKYHAQRLNIKSGVSATLVPNYGHCFTAWVEENGVRLDIDRSATDWEARVALTNYLDKFETAASKKQEKLHANH